MHIERQKTDELEHKIELFMCTNFWLQRHLQEEVVDMTNEEQIQNIF